MVVDWVVLEVHRAILELNGDGWEVHWDVMVVDKVIVEEYGVIMEGNRFIWK